MGLWAGRWVGLATGSWRVGWLSVFSDGCNPLLPWRSSLLHCLEEAGLTCLSGPFPVLSCSCCCSAACEPVSLAALTVHPGNSSKPFGAESGTGGCICQQGPCHSPSCFSRGTCGKAGPQARVMRGMEGCKGDACPAPVVLVLSCVRCRWQALPPVRFSPLLSR